MAPTFSMAYFSKTPKNLGDMMSILNVLMSIQLPFAVIPMLTFTSSRYVNIRGTSIIGEVRNVEIPGPTQQLLCSKHHDFLAVFPLAHSKINQISLFLDEIIQKVSD